MRKAMGTEFPAKAPRKYRQNLQRVELFNTGIAYDRQELLRWHARFSDELSPKAEEILGGYLERGYLLGLTLVEHPKVQKPALFAACNVWLQRGIIVERGQMQTLLLQSYLHSTADEKTFVNFVPVGGVRMTFQSSPLWFPLELTSVNQEPTSFVVLDVLTKKALGAGTRLPNGLHVGKRGRVSFEGSQFYATRITGALDTRKKHADLQLKV
jgi:hypothetical protein